MRKKLEEYLNKLQNPIMEAPEDPSEIRYAGFNVRLMAQLLDTILIMFVMAIITYFVSTPQKEMSADQTEYHIQTQKLLKGEISLQQFDNNFSVQSHIHEVIIPDFIKSFLFTTILIGAIYIIAWRIYNTTPGKLVFGLRIVDAKTMKNPSFFQYIMRYIGYIVALLPLMIGYLMIPFVKKKRGLHDFIAGTAVIYFISEDSDWGARKKKLQAYAFVAALLFIAIYIATLK